jgi:hypothetical protein
MLDAIAGFYLEKDEPVKSVLMALRDIVLGSDPRLAEAWKYKMPCFTFMGKPFCYLWIDKKTREPYILFVKGGQVEHPGLIQGNRAKMKIFPVNPHEDLPIESIRSVITKAMAFYLP